MTDPNTIEKALAFIATAEAGLLEAYRTALVKSYGIDSEFVRGVMPAIQSRRIELMRLQQRARRAGASAS